MIHEFAVCDLNGVLRGKRIPESMVPKILSGNARMPASILACDIWGEDLASNEFLASTGDADVRCVPTGREPLLIDWLDTPTSLIPMWLAHDDGTPFYGDPRRELESICQRYRERSLYPVVALELEFYLVEIVDGVPRPIRSPLNGRRFDRDTILSIDEIEQLEGFFVDVYRACEQQGIPVEAASAENGPCQFEINLRHADDPLRAADDAVYLKRLIRGMARKHGHVATFMAKPYGSRSGNSMHTHFSLLDENDVNLFDDGTKAGSDMLRSAIGGLLHAMQELMLVHAPHVNSYRRFQNNSLAPMQASWGHENRTTAIRIPGGPTSSRRLEHRISGADANPYLVLAAVLGAALRGIENDTDPGPPASGYTYGNSLPELYFNWERSIEDFARGSIATDIFSSMMIDMFTSFKRYEAGQFSRSISRFEYDTYLETA